MKREVRVSVVKVNVCVCVCVCVCVRERERERERVELCAACFPYTEKKVSLCLQLNIFG